MPSSSLAPLPLELQLQTFIEAQPDIQRWVIAYSGGLDSSVLLSGMVRVLAHLNASTELLAVHVHHGLSPLADQWQQHCETQCQALGVELVSRAVEVVNDGKGLEDAARQARYQVFEALLEEGDGLLLGHHLDDQAETLLLRLMRGSGTRGLSAMAASRSLEHGRLYRPLFDCGREELERYAAQRELQWVEDDSNASERFDRNYLRLQVMPLLKQRWPELGQRWAQSAQWCAEADSLITEVAAEDLARAEPRAERGGYSLALPVLASLSAYRRGNLLRHWCDSLGVSLPGTSHLQALESQCLTANSDSAVEICWGELRLRRFRERLYLLIGRAELPTDAGFKQQIDGWHGEPIQWGAARLSLEPVAIGGFRVPEQGFSVTFRRHGERCRPSWRKHSQTLKKLLQESQLEPWLRDQIPCLRAEGDLAVVGDLWHCADWSAEEGKGYRLIWADDRHSTSRSE